jgi:hypothetical protein
MLIGLVGRSRAGKDTIAAMLAQTHNLEIRRLAQPVKDACKALYGWSDTEVESSLKEARDARWDVTPRMAMVHLTAAMRTFMGAGFFTQRFFDEVKEDDRIVIPDVRFFEDVREIHRRGGVTILVTRKGTPEHEFEHGIEYLPTTHVVTNDGTIEELRAAVKRLLGPSVSSGLVR